MAVFQKGAWIVLLWTWVNIHLLRGRSTNDMSKVNIVTASIIPISASKMQTAFFFCFFFASFCLTSEIPFLSVLPLLSYVKFVQTILFLKWPGLKAVRLRRLESPFQVLEKVYGRTDGNAAVHVLSVKRSSGLKALCISPCVCLYYLGNSWLALKITKQMFWVIYSRWTYYSWKENIR